VSLALQILGAVLLVVGSAIAIHTALRFPPEDPGGLK